MTTSKRLVEENRPLWTRMTGHPFVIATGAGTLDAKAFERWLVADHAFVVEFRRFLAGLVTMAPDEPARDVLTGALGALRGELELFRGELAARGLPADGEPSPTGLGYTSYLRASLLDGYPVALSVLYGAERAYLDAWLVVRDRADHDSPYWPFIDNWSSPEFVAWVDAVAGLLDRATTDGPTEAMREAFGRVVRFELKFWDSVYSGETW